MQPASEQAGAPSDNVYLCARSLPLSLHRHSRSPQAILAAVLTRSSRARLRVSLRVPDRATTKQQAALISTRKLLELRQDSYVAGGARAQLNSACSRT